jgi:hypothetical protein
MMDRQFLKLNDDWALAHDRPQWIVQNCRKHKGQDKWQAIAFIPSEKRVLTRVIREKGIPVSPEAEAALNGLPATFQEFLAQRDSLGRVPATPGTSALSTPRCDQRSSRRTRNDPK